MLKIGLTGSIASGKSEVGRLLASRGAFVVDADRVAHTVYAPGTEGYAVLIQAFGAQIVAEGGAIDRGRLGTLVFADPAEMRKLTNIVWPLTRQAVEQMAHEQKTAGVRVFVVEAALLVDAGWSDYFDEVWLIRAPPSVVRQRLEQRGLTNVEIEARLAAATGEELAASAADIVIENDGDLASLEEVIEAHWKRPQDQA